MSKVKGLQKGFTLIEILVILAVLAILAGVLIPAVANQVTKADAERVASDLENMRTGIEAFVVDTKRYPGDVEDLIVKPATSESDINGDAIPDGLSAKWTGPYIDLVGTATTDSFASGFAGYIQNDLDTAKVGTTKYVTLVVRGIAKSDFYKVDARIDGDTGVTKGRLRWAAGASSAADSVKFLAMPIN